MSARWIVCRTCGKTKRVAGNMTRCRACETASVRATGRNVGAMSKTQMTFDDFKAACKAEGFTPDGVPGFHYYELGIPGKRIHVSTLNAPTQTYEGLLDYLRSERARER